MKKSFLKIVAAAFVFAAVLSSCSNVSENQVQDEAVLVSEADGVSVSAVSSRSVNAHVVRISSDLNPGFGQAVFFTGTFEEGNSWTTAVRGTYDNGWYADVTSGSDFEWKALVGSYDLGVFVQVSSSLTWENGANHFVEVSVPTENLYMLTAPGLARYGQTCYFTGTFNEGDNWQTAVHAVGYDSATYRWYVYVTSDNPNFEWKYLTGFGSQGETFAAPYPTFNWSTGANFTQDDAYTFEEGFALTSAVSYFDAYYNISTQHLNFNGNGIIYGGNSLYQDVSATIIEVLAGNEVVYSANYNDVFENGIDFAADRFDYTVYTARLTPVSIFGTRGTPSSVDFCPAMTKITSAYFTMGSDSDDATDNAEHTVIISKPYYIANYEVTDGQFKEIFGISSSVLGYKQYTTDNSPAICLSFPFAIAYCNKLSIAEGYEPVYSVEGVDFETVTFSDVRYLSAAEKALWNAPSVNWDANGYRLPTEAEWEYAASVYGTYDYSGSDDIDEVAVTMYTNQYRPAEVGSKAPNYFGIYDMSGNVEEWVWDWYADYTTETQYSPIGPDSGEFHIVRGGGFSTSDLNVFKVYTRTPMVSYSSSTGLRLVRNAR